jgi:hypothetical protein
LTGKAGIDIQFVKVDLFFGMDVDDGHSDGLVVGVDGDPDGVTGEVDSGGDGVVGGVFHNPGIGTVREDEGGVTFHGGEAGKIGGGGATDGVGGRQRLTLLAAIIFTAENAKNAEDYLSFSANPALSAVN